MLICIRVVSVLGPEVGSSGPDGMLKMVLECSGPEARGVWGAIEQKGPRAAIDERTVQMALAAIYQGAPEDLLLAIAEKETTKEAWEAIKTMCMGVERVQEVKVQTLKGEFESLMMKDSEKIEDFCLKLSGIVTNIRVLGEAMEESSVVRKIL
ncbi:hypothetical protein AgCh_009478 [Apium graveolens]